MAAPGGDRRSPMAVGIEMYSQILSIAVMMALPAGVGYWVDSCLGTAPWLVVAGAALGLTGGMVQLLRVVGGVKKIGGVEKKSAENKDYETDETQR
jgi:F0F1-type ATP synthase assembly protein I